jgi:hypothetical protein
MVVGLLFAAALSTAAAEPVPRALQHYEYFLKRPGCATAHSFVQMWTCNTQDRDFLAREIVNGDLSGLRVIDGICESPWHVVERETGLAGEPIYDAAVLQTLSSADGKLRVPLRNAHDGRVVGILVWNLHGLTSKYAGVVPS